MKTMSALMIVLPILSALLYGVFGFEWWIEMTMPEDTLRGVVIIGLHLASFVGGIVIFDEGE
jgi:hypothetical protein